MRDFFKQPHPWLMQGLGGLIALIIMIPIAIYVTYSVLINGKPPAAAPTYAVPAVAETTVPPPASTPVNHGGGSTVAGSAIAHPRWADVHKIFVANCQPCHVGAVTAGLSLATYQSAMKGGSTAAGGVVNGPVIKPGDAKGSYLYQAVTWTEKVGANMPLGKPQISKEDQQTIYNWIQQGAKD